MNSIVKSFCCKRKPNVYNVNLLDWVGEVGEEVRGQRAEEGQRGLGTSTVEGYGRVSPMNQYWVEG